MAEAAGADGPRVERPLTLHWRGDWGQANIHRVCGWLAQEIGDRAGPGTKSAIWTGRGFTDNVLAAARGEVDIALTTPATFVAMALDGRGPYAGEASPHLRALGQVPHRDLLVVGVAAETGIRSFADWREKQAGLRVATGLGDGVNHVGLAARAVLAAHGITEDDLRAWGGGFVESDRPHPCVDWLREGRVDAIVNEAVMTPGWVRLAEARDVTFLALEDEALAQLEGELGWRRAVLPAGYWPGVEEDVPSLDFSDFLLVTTEALPDDVAHLVAWCLGETSEAIERQYRHLPQDRTPVSYPFDRRHLGRTPIPLHPGAARYFATVA